VKRILFVDDEPRVLEGLKRMLYPFRRDWNMTFVTSGQEALKLMDESEFDVVVTDVRMPQMTGIQFLSEVVKKHPQVVRMVLSGMADKEVTLPSVMLAHQYLDKPCDPKVLRATVERAFNLRVMLANPELKQLVSRVHSLPSIPSVYTELIQAIQSPDVSAKEIGRIIGQDLAMTAKILQLVNSAFFGVRRQVTSAAEAVIYLGVDTVRALALTISVFSQFDTREIPGFSIETLRDHGLTVATLARHIAHSLHLSKTDVEDAFLGGLLHELGKLVLACNYPKEYRAVLEKLQQPGARTRQAELEVFGTTHAEVGAYLLWLWGLPDAVTEIVAHYEHPDPEQATRSLIAVHVANGLSTEPEREIDCECLAAMGLIEHLPEWMHMGVEAKQEAEA
jgi:putative nucleotidyltransferase with HDIG domain